MPNKQKDKDFSIFLLLGPHTGRRNVNQQTATHVASANEDHRDEARASVLNCGADFS